MPIHESGPANAAAQLPDAPIACPVQVRVPTLDLLRGIAVLGILLVNIYSFALPEVVRLDASLMPHYSNFEQWCWYLIYFFADTKFIALLSLAFGASLWLFAADKQALTDSELNNLQWRRSISLLVFGAAHGYLLWDGDVLVTYALFSFVVWRWRYWGDRKLMFTALILFAIQALLYGGMFWLPADVWQELSYMFDEAALAEEMAHYQQGWWQQASRRFADALSMQLIAVFGGWFPCSMMLVGVVLARRGYFSAQAPANSSRLLMVTLLLGALLMLLTLLLNRASGFTSQYALTLGMELQMFASGVLAIAYALLIARWARTLVWPVCRAVLMAVGRMALTIYIMQTLIFTSIFYGYGLGWYGQLALSQLLLVIFSVWILQCVFAVLWLRYFYSGPLEWLWRRFVYQRASVFLRHS